MSTAMKKTRYTFHLGNAGEVLEKGRELSDVLQQSAWQFHPS